MSRMGAAEAAVRYQELIRLPRDAPNYRDVCSTVIDLAAEIGKIDFRFDHFVTPFLAEGPKNDQDLDAFYRLGELYQRFGLFENAREVFGKIATQRPDFRNAGDRYAELRAMRGGKTAPPPPAPAREGDAPARPYTMRTLLPDLPDLPDLPPLPAPAPPPTKQSNDHTRMVGRRPRKTDPGSSESGGGEGSASVRGAPAVQLAVGSVIAERYRLTKQLGEGGTATVFEAVDLELDEPVALKLFKSAIGDEKMDMRFKQELRVSRQLSHRNIIRVHDIGSFQGLQYISMEILEGASLGSVLRQGFIGFERGFDYLNQACAGLQVAHDRGIIHRDVNPNNLFITTEGEVKVMDFGLAKATSASARFTTTGMIAGTPHYISPEQINDTSRVGIGTDLYALGVTSYQMFTRTVPFDDEEILPLLMKHLNDSPESPRGRNPDIPKDLDRLILRLLEKDPAARPPSCNAVQEELAGIAERMGFALKPR